MAEKVAEPKQSKKPATKQHVTPPALSHQAERLERLDLPGVWLLHAEHLKSQ